MIAFSWLGTPFPFPGIKQLYGTGSDSNFARSELPEIDALEPTRSPSRTDVAKRTDLGQPGGQDPVGLRPHPAAVPAPGADRRLREDIANYGAFGFQTPVKWEDVGWMS